MAVKAKAKRKNKKLNKKNKFIIALSVVLAFALAIGGSALVFRGREKVYYDFGKETASTMARLIGSRSETRSILCLFE